jgi:hypothetical protein
LQKAESSSASPGNFPTRSDGGAVLKGLQAL